MLRKKSFNLRAQIVYEIALSIMVFYDVVIRQSTLNDVIEVSFLSDVLWVVILSLLFIKIFQTKYSLMQFFVVIIISVLCVGSSLVSGEITMIKFMVFSIGIINCDIDRVLKRYIQGWVIWSFVVVLLALIGGIPNYSYGSRYGLERLCLGFDAPSAIGYLSFNLLYYFFSKNYKHIKLRLFALVGVLLLILWYVVNCKTAIIINVIMILMFLVARFFPKVFCGKWISLVLIISVWFSVYFVSNFTLQNKIHERLNSFLSLRLFYANEYYKMTGINWFGHTTGMEELSEVWLDNSYHSLILRFGIVALVLLVVIYLVSIRKIKQNNDFVSGIGVVSAILYGITETTLYTFGTNIVLFIVVYYFWGALRKERSSLLLKENI